MSVTADRAMSLIERLNDPLPAPAKAGTAHELACALLVTVQPTDRALIGWGIEPKQVSGLLVIAQRGAS